MSLKEKSVAVVRRLREAGHQAYLAGGCVRDALLGKTPQDYDIATDAKPEAIRELFSRTIEVGAQFGVVMVLVDGDSFEVATFRYDGPYLDGRRPSEVRFAGMQEDILRRDFTINGMMYDPVDDRIIDLVGGREDLARRVVRAIGEPRERFREDSLRMVRAVRFAAGLGFAVDAATLAAIRAEAATIERVSWERIGDEISRILIEGGARRGFELLDDTGLLAVILPEITAMKGVEQSPDHHPEGDVFCHTLLLLEKMSNLDSRISETLAYGCLLHDVGKPLCVRREGDKITFYGHTERGAEMAVAILRRLKQSRAVWERVAYLVKNHLRHIQAPKMRLSTLKRFLGEDGIDELLELTRIDALASNGDLQYYAFCRQKLEELKHEEIHPEPLLRGKDLIAMGLKPGPLFQEILRQLEEHQLESEINTREQAMAWVAKRYGERGLS